MDDLERLEWERDEAILRADRAEDEVAIQFDVIREQVGVIRRMASRLDELERPPPLLERQNTVTAEWRGPAADYYGNSAEINRTLARRFSEMIRDAAEPENPLNFIPTQRNHAHVVESHASDALEAASGQDPPNALPGEPGKPQADRRSPHRLSGPPASER